ncbi:MAG: hypothetical protein V8T86_03850 [Victivallis sp.]
MIRRNTSERPAGTARFGMQGTGIRSRRAPMPGPPFSSLIQCRRSTETKPASRVTDSSYGSDPFTIWTAFCGLTVERLGVGPYREITAVTGFDRGEGVDAESPRQFFDHHVSSRLEARITGIAFLHGKPPFKLI